MERNKNITKLRELLILYYTEIEELTVLIADSGLNKSRIQQSKISNSYLQNILEEANKQDKISKVLEVAAKRFPKLKSRLKDISRTSTDDMPKKARVIDFPTSQMESHRKSLPKTAEYTISQPYQKEIKEIIAYAELEEIKEEECDEMSDLLEDLIKMILEDGGFETIKKSILQGMIKDTIELVGKYRDHLDRSTKDEIYSILEHLETRLKQL